MTVIFSKREDTIFLQKIWNGLPLINIVEIEKPDDYHKIEPALKQESDCLLLCGHGSPSGLISPVLGSFIVDDKHADLLRGKTVIGIWCYAALFADYNNLSGFFSNMFISDVHEASSFGYQIDKYEIDKENNIFASRINDLLKREIPIAEWENAMSLFRKNYPQDSFAYFNYCGFVNLDANDRFNA